MKLSLKNIALLILISIGAATYSQTQKDSLGLPGDNLDLTAVLNIFKQSNSIEEFEKKLNAADTKVNNLDLNHDGQVDYIRVIESGKDNTHTVVLQVPISKSESQDVAVIQLQKNADNTVHVQIVGDEALYGKNYIIEPQEQPQVNKSQTTQTNQPQSTTTTQPQTQNNNNQQVDDIYADPGSANNNNSQGSVNNNYYGTPQTNVYVNVWGWPCVPLMFAPSYSFWVSPWYWGYYPGWWSPWAPYGWYGYHQRMMGFGFYGRGGYYGFCRRSYYNRMGGAYAGYYGRRVSSSYVQKTTSPRGSVVVGPRNFGGRQANTGTKLGGGVKTNAVSQAGKWQPKQQTQSANPKQNFSPKQQQSAPQQQKMQRNNGGGGWNRGGGGGGGRMGGGGGGRRR